MKTKLLNGLDDRGVVVAKEDFAKAVGFRKHLSSVLEKEIESIHASMRDEDSFNSNNWAYLQADRVAQVKALKKVIGLLQ